MTKRLNSKHKVDRRLKVNLWGRPKSPFNTRAYPTGQHGQTKAGKPSDYGIQLQAKQKLKSYYGNMNERQFRNVYKKAIMKKGDTAENLIGLLERRLDAVIYRSKLSNTIFSSRQLINHGHVKVNGKKVNIASYQVKEEDTENGDIVVARIDEDVTLKRFSKNKTSIKLIAENSAYEDIHVPEQTDFAIEGKAVGVIRESV